MKKEDYQKLFKAYSVNEPIDILGEQVFIKEITITWKSLSNWADISIELGKGQGELHFIAWDYNTSWDDIEGETE